jgi:hypothetical protein
MPKVHPLAKVTAQSRQLLTDQTISIDGPGTLLRDVQTLIAAIGIQGLATKSNRGNLPSGLLPELNARMSCPLDIPLKRPLLRDFPNVAGAYILLRVLDLVRTNASRVWIDAERLTAWGGLNPTEQYFTLLETWLLEADRQVLGGESRSQMDSFSLTLGFLADTLSARGRTFREGVHTYAFPDAGVSTWNVFLMVQLGLIEVVPSPMKGRNPHQGSQGWQMEQARRTPWGEAVAWAIRQQLVSLGHLTEADPLFYLEPPRHDGPGFFQPAFQPYFPEYQKLFVPQPPAERPGVYIFKVGFPPRYGPSDVWRRLAVPHEATLDDVAGSILAAFEFMDDEHLHDFRFRDQTGREQVYYHRYAEEGPYSTEVGIGELNLPEKATLTFAFDYGAGWRFLLQLERILPLNSKQTKIEVIGSQGKAPEQYEGDG